MRAPSIRVITRTVKKKRERAACDGPTGQSSGTNSGRAVCNERIDEKSASRSHRASYYQVPERTHTRTHTGEAKILLFSPCVITRNVRSHLSLLRRKSCNEVDRVVKTEQERVPPRHSLLHILVYSMRAIKRRIYLVSHVGAIKRRYRVLSLINPSEFYC